MSSFGLRFRLYGLQTIFEHLLYGGRSNPEKGVVSCQYMLLS